MLLAGAEAENIAAFRKLLSNANLCWRGCSTSAFDDQPDCMYYRTGINLLNPSRLALGGGTFSLPGYFDAAKEAAAQLTIPELWQTCSLSGVRSGETVAALGAVRTGMNKSFHPTYSTE